MSSVNSVIFLVFSNSLNRRINLAKLSNCVAALPLTPVIMTFSAASIKERPFISANACNLAKLVAPIPRLGSLATRAKLKESFGLAAKRR